MNAQKTLELQTTDTSEKLVMMRLMQENLSYHDHHFFELAYVVSGTAKHELNGISGTLQPGDYFFIDFGSSHSYEQVQDLDLINCLFLPEFIDETLQGCKSLNTLLQACMIRYHQLTIGESWADRIFHDQDGQIGQLLIGMVDEYKNKKLGSTEIFRCRLTEILIHTLRMLVQPHRPQSNSTIINDVLHFADFHYHETISLQNFCAQKHYNISYISRRFKQETGMTFRDYIQKLRMEKCCELLAGSNIPISDIARMIGYEDIQFFHAVFKKYLHMPPREYRRLKGITKKS